MVVKESLIGTYKISKENIDILAKKALKRSLLFHIIPVNLIIFWVIVISNIMMLGLGIRVPFFLFLSVTSIGLNILMLREGKKTILNTKYELTNKSIRVDRNGKKHEVLFRLLVDFKKEKDGIILVDLLDNYVYLSSKIENYEELEEGIKKRIPKTI